MWGIGFFGALGNGCEDHSTVPLEIALPDGVRFSFVTGGRFHTVALTPGGVSSCLHSVLTRVPGLFVHRFGGPSFVCTGGCARVSLIALPPPSHARYPP